MYILENVINNIKNDIKDILKDYKVENFDVEIPADNKNGDLSTNVALISAKLLKMSPRKIADMVIENIKKSEYIDKVEVAGPGFINFFLSSKFFSEVLDQIILFKENYGKSSYGNAEKIILEFVSANPTGPMHIGNARGGAFGDTLAQVLNFCGYNVYKEFYVNDAGNQIEKFGKSLDIRYQQICNGDNYIDMPEDCYQGQDIKKLALEFFDIHGNKYLNLENSERQKELIKFALPKNISRMKKDMQKYKVKYDNWFFESDLHNQGKVKEIIDILTQKGATYEKDGSLWYKATNFGSEKDEVLVRKNGIPTYFAADIAYHYNKLVTRNFDKAIDIWGADHHGHIKRMKGAMQALGINSDRLHVILYQLVRLIKNGEPFKMSKRSGKSIELSDLLDEVSVDSARFIFNSYEAGNSMDFDIDVAVSKDFQNPVYYVQYAHARICSIFKNGDIKNLDIKNANLNLLNSGAERKLIYFMANYPLELIKAAKNFDPAKIIKYVVNLAGLFHKFYSSCKVLTDDKNLSSARLLLCQCVRIMIKNILDMLKAEAPELMQ